MKLLLYSAFLFLPFAGFAQNNDDFRETPFLAKNGNPDWLTPRAGVQLTVTDVLRGHLTGLGLTENDELVWSRTDTDPLGIAHHRYRQHHRGVPVDGAEWLIHEKDGQVRSMNGKLARGLQTTSVQPVLAAPDAVKRALIYLPAQRYMWEDAAAEEMLKRTHNDRSATFYPRPQLVLAAPDDGRRPDAFRLAWKMIVYAQQPHSRKTVFVDAVDGQILDAFEMLCTNNTPGTAQTKYSGERSIITEALDTNLYRLRETTRGSGIETYDMQRTTSVGNAVDFTDADNFWSNFNGKQDEAATDAHWGTEMTYDYFLEKHDYRSLDGADMPMISYVHYDIDLVNAFWNGSWATFGDGDGVETTALTSLDVVGHEFTHGVTDFTANLRYRNESGALNESFSDIFGATVEFFADPDNGDWLVGEDFHVEPGGAFRNMANPNAEGDPDTYKGKSWVTGEGDNGGVHTNSGVQNYWFYLLSEGDAGINDNGENYDVKGLGLDAAGQIAFHNLRYYLVELSNYADAREGALQAAEDLFGLCSEAYKTTANAWFAAGVGEPLYDYDVRALQITEPAPLACGFGDAQNISVQIRYNDCSFDLLPGEQIPLAYQIDNGPLVWDTLTLSSTLKGGDTLNFTFAVPAAAFATPGVYSLRFTSALGADVNLKNNAVALQVESVADQNADMRLQKVYNLFSGCFLNQATPAVQISYYGCDSIPAGEAVDVFFSINGQAPVSETVKLPKTLHLGESFQAFLNTPVDLSAKGAYDVKAWLQYGPDTVTGNDSIADLQVVNPKPLFVQNILTFEAQNSSLDSAYSDKGIETQGVVSAQAARNSQFGYLITGNNFPKALLDGTAQLPTQENVWDVNPQFQSKLCICADLTNLSDADLRFDRRQTYSSYYQKNFGFNIPHASALGIWINGASIGALYKPVSQSIDPWLPQKVSLKDFVGSTAEICFRTSTLLNPLYDSTGIGDKVMLDNIAITGTVVSSSHPAAATTAWTVMPNPGNGLFTISLQSPAAQELPIEVWDALGRSVRTLYQTVAPGANQIALNLEGATPGVYLLRVGGQTGKIVIRG